MGLRKQTGATEPELSTNRFVGVAGWGAAQCRSGGGRSAVVGAARFSGRHSDLRRPKEIQGDVRVAWRWLVRMCVLAAKNRQQKCNLGFAATRKIGQRAKRRKTKRRKKEGLKKVSATEREKSFESSGQVGKGIGSQKVTPALMGDYGVAQVQQEEH